MKKALWFIAIVSVNAVLCTFVYGFIEGMGSQSWALAWTMGISFGAGGLFADLSSELKQSDSRTSDSPNSTVA